MKPVVFSHTNIATYIEGVPFSSKHVEVDGLVVVITNNTEFKNKLSNYL